MIGPVTVVCGTDLSEHSRAALEQAAAIVDRFGGSLTVIAAVDPLLSEASRVAWHDDIAREQMESALAEFVTKTTATAPTAASADRVVVVGDAADKILETAGRRGATLVIVATHGLGGYRKMAFGSTTERVLRHATLPVLVVPPAGAAGAHWTSPRFTCPIVLVPVDFHEHALEDARRAVTVADGLGVPVLLLHVVPPLRGPDFLRPHAEARRRIARAEAQQQLDDLAAALKGSVSIETAVREGRPAEEIAVVAAERQAGLIVMGLRGTGGILGHRPGSVAYSVLALGPAMVLALPIARGTAPGTPGQ